MIATKIQAACLQTPVGGTINANLAATDEMLRHAAERGSKIVCLPEYFSFPIFSPDTATPAMIHEIRKQTLLFLQHGSSEYGLLIVGNALAIKDNGVFNTAYVYDRGELLGKQEKVHPTFKERVYKISPGQSYEPIKTRFGVLGILLCADILYPEASRVLGLLQADIVFNPVASFVHDPDPTKKARTAMFIARAYDNSFFLLKCGGVGQTITGTQVVGRSLITAPWGILAQAEDERQAALVTAELDLTRLHDHRAKNYSLHDRNPQAYRPLVDTSGVGSRE